MNRREVVRILSGGALGLTALRARALGATAALGEVTSAARDRLDRIGVQLYTVRREMARDVEGTLARVAEIGFREVEFAGYFGQKPREVRAALDAAGLDAPAAHVSFNLLQDGWEQTLEAASVIGHHTLIVPWIAEERRTLDGYRAAAELFNSAGEAARAAGRQLGYHNHDFEFERIDGRVPFDVLLEATDPDLVVYEMDLFWVTNGGHDPIDYIARYPGRFALVHVKDRSADGAMVDVGQGTIDFAEIFARRTQAGIRHYFVEHDRPGDPFASIQTSYDFLRALEF
jgi:sugar phosphate isomerase/epimerase